MIQLDNLLEKAPNTIILGNGAFPVNPQVLNLLKQARTLICCDGAVNKLEAFGMQPDIVVGDLDSLSAEAKQRYSNNIHPDKSEDYNDMQKSLKYCMQHDLDDLLLLGFAGLREDHFIANVSILANYCSQLRMTMITDYGIFTAFNHTTTLKAVPGMQVSIFTTHHNLPLTFHGLKYAVNQRCFQYLWEASLNEALDTTFTIELHAPGTVVVYRAVGYKQ